MLVALVLEIWVVNTFHKLAFWKRFGAGASWDHLGSVLGRLGSILEAFWSILGRLRLVLVRSWALLWWSWGALGRSWGALGALLAALGALLGALGAHLAKKLKKTTFVGLNLRPKIEPKIYENRC